MFSLLSKLFVSEKSIDNVVSAAIATGDKLVFTAEEKAEMNVKLQDWYLKYLEATQPMNLSRRVIAITVTGLWSLFLILATSLLLGGDKEISGAIFSVMETHLNLPFSIIVGFYFAAQMASRANNK